MSKGCNDLIYRNKAHLLQSAEDIVQMLNWDISTSSTQSVSKTTKPIQKELFVELNSEEERIYNYLKEKNQQILDLIALETHIPVYQLAPILLQMELKGLIKPLPGKLFELV